MNYIETLTTQGKYRVIMTKWGHYKVASIEEHWDGCPMYVSSDRHELPVNAVRQMVNMAEVAEEHDLFIMAMHMATAAKRLGELLMEERGN